MAGGETDKATIVKGNLSLKKTKKKRPKEQL